MFFKKPVNNTKALSVSDDFFNIIEYDSKNKLIIADLYYDINQYTAIKNKLLTTSVTILSKVIENEDLFSQSENQIIDSRKIIQKLSTEIRDINISFKEQQNYVLLKKDSDFTSKVNNELLPELKTGNSSSNKKTIIKSKKVADVKKTDSNLVNLFIKNSYNELSSSVSKSEIKKIATDFILTQNVDPSNVLEKFNNLSTPAETKNGIYSKKSIPSSATETKLISILDKITPSIKDNLKDFFDDEFIDVIEKVDNSRLNVPIRVKIPSTSIVDNSFNSNYLFKFELIDSKTKLTVETVVKELDVSKQLKLFLIPKSPPVVRVSSSTNSRIILDIKQTDKNATSVNVYKKVISKSINSIDNEYLFLGNYSTGEFGSSTLIKFFNTNPTSINLFRIVPVGDNDNESYEYTNIAISNNRSNIKIKSLSLITTIEDDAIKLEALNFPSNLVSICFYARNLSLHEKQFTKISDQILVTDEIKSTDYFTFLHNNLKDGNIYEYTTKLIYANGLSTFSNNSVIEFVKKNTQEITTKIDNIQISESDISFTMNTKMIMSNIDIVVQLLRKQNYDQYYQNEILNEKEKLQSLIVHQVQRIDLDTGEKFNFGIITDNSFTESVYRDSNNIHPIKKGKKYKYEITAIVRNPDTIFEFEKNSIDANTKKPYKFLPLKFKHPIVEKTGMLVSSKGIKFNFAKNEYAYGIYGNTVFIDIGKEKTLSSINNLSVFKSSLDTYTLSWTVDDLKDIDHFIIFAITNGNKILVGKSHSNFRNNSCFYIHNVKKSNLNATSYAILPVYKTYDLGNLEISGIVNQ